MNRTRRSGYHQVRRLPPPPPLPRPVLGARVMATPHCGDPACKPESGIVIHVHETHHWYTVRFASGITESYKWGTTE